MGILLDASTPTNTAITFASTSVVSASFNPPSGSIIEAVVVVDGAGGINQSVTSVTNTGTALIWHLLKRANGTATAGPNGLGGSAEIWWAYNGAAQTGITVTANFANSSIGTVSPGGLHQVLVFTGAAPDQSAAACSSVSQTPQSAAPSGTVSTTGVGSWVWGAVINWTSAAVGSPGLAPIYSSRANVTDGDAYWIQQQTAPTPTVATSVVIDDGSPSSICYNMIVWEVLPGAAGGPATPGIPASGVPFLNPYGMNAEAFVVGGTVSGIAIDGQTLGVTSGPIIVPYGHTITLTYSVAPTWIWVLF